MSKRYGINLSTSVARCACPGKPIH